MTTNFRQLHFSKISTFANTLLRSTYLDYANDRTLLTFQCEQCDNMLLASAHDYYCGKTLCEICRSYHEDPIIEFKKNASKTHGDYYQYVEYLPNSVSIKCPKHGIFNMHPDQHLDGVGCDQCKLEDSTNITITERDSFIEKANQIYGFSYRYDYINYIDSDTTVSVRCPKHGSYLVTPNQHMSGVGCTICMKKARVMGEVTTKLQTNGVTYSLEKTFTDCVSDAGIALHFDIFVPEKNLCVEFDNIHHYQPTKYSNDVSDSQVDTYFEIQQRNDLIKHQYCVDHHINFIRIPYTTMFPSAVLLKYMKDLSDQRLIYTWKDFEKDITNIITYIKTFNYAKFAVYGVSRGGVPFAVHVSNHFEGMCEYGCVSFQRYDGNSKEVIIAQEHPTVGLPIFIIDDLISSGITMTKVVDKLKWANPTSNIHPIVIFGTANAKGVQYMNVHPMKWIVFPYEV